MARIQELLVRSAELRTPARRASWSSSRSRRGTGAVGIVDGSTERSRWRQALRATRGAWKAGFERRPATRPEVALALAGANRGVPIEPEIAA
jgi:hypothetical protein